MGEGGDAGRVGEVEKLRVCDGGELHMNSCPHTEVEG